MIDATRTTTALLAGLFDPDNAAIWAEFDARYRPILVAFGRRLGLNDADAADAAQEALVEFLQAYRAGRYDRTRGRLRAWLIGITKTRVAAIFRSKSRHRVERGASAIINLDDDAHLTSIWEAERRTVILREALAELRATSRANDATIRAFELFALRQMPVAAVADETGLTEQQVYVAKSRMASRLREIIAKLESAFDEDES